MIEVPVQVPPRIQPTSAARRLVSFAAVAPGVMLIGLALAWAQRGALHGNDHVLWLIFVAASVAYTVSAVAIAQPTPPSRT